MKSNIPQRTFEFAREIIALCIDLEKQPGVSRIIGRQLLRSGTSVGANIEEGQASQSDADFINKYSIACKEARETRYWLRLLAASAIAPGETLDRIDTKCNEIIAILTSIIKKMRAKLK